MLKDAGSFTASSINGFTFADRLVLENVTLSGTPTYAGGVLTVNQAGGLPPLTFSMPDPDGHLTGLNVQAATSGTSAVISFVAPAGGIAPDVSGPPELRGAAGVAVLVPDVVLQTPLASGLSPGAATYAVTVQATNGIVRIEGFSTVELGGGASKVDIPLSLTTDLAKLEQYLQTLTYQARNTTGDRSRSPSPTPPREPAPPASPSPTPRLALSNGRPPAAALTSPTSTTGASARRHRAAATSPCSPPATTPRRATAPSARSSTSARPRSPATSLPRESAASRLSSTMAARSR